MYIVKRGWRMKQEDFFSILKKRTKSMVIFCGAGLSRDSGLPGVKEFYELFETGELNRAELESNPNLRIIFWRMLMSKISYNYNHKSVLRLAEQGYFDTIITSNYDLCFEKCIDSKFPHWNESINQSQKCEKSFLGGKKTLIKIHGDIDQESVLDINLLQLTLGSESEEATRSWKKVFSHNEPKDLWIIGYSGKSEDYGYKLICKSVKNQEIHNIYWMYREEDKSNIGRIKEQLSGDNVSFILIDDAKELFKQLIEFIFGNDFEDEPLIVEEMDKLNLVRQASAVAKNTVSLLSKIDDRILLEMERAEEKFSNLLTAGNPLGLESKLIVLRRYNSYTPVLPFKEADSKGGGYFLIHNNCGIVIDPGFDFLENYFSHKWENKYNDEFRLNHINAIIITHAHNDHFGELDTIQNLIFQYNKRVELKQKLYEFIKRTIDACNGNNDIIVKQKIIKNIKKIVNDDNPLHVEANIAIDLLNSSFHDGEYFKKLRVIEEYTRVYPVKMEIDLFVSRSALKAIDGLIPINKSPFKTIHILNPGDRQSYNDIEIQATKAKHADMYSALHSIGLIFKIKIEQANKNCVIGITGDSGYFAGMENSYKECDILITHIGSIKPKELEIYYNKDNKIKDVKNEVLINRYKIPDLKEVRSNSAFYQNHLGILGLISLVSALKAVPSNPLKVVVISEYGEEMRTFRHYLTNLLQQLFINSQINFPKFVTGDIGLEINFFKIIQDIWSIEEKADESVTYYNYE